MAEEQSKPMTRREFLSLARDAAKVTALASVIPTDSLRAAHSFFNEPYPTHSLLAFGDEGGTTIDQLALQYGCTSEDLISANPWLVANSVVKPSQIVAIPNHTRLPEPRDVKFIYPRTGALLKQVSSTGHQSWKQGELVDVEQKTGLVFFQEYGKGPELVASHELQVRDGQFADEIINKNLDKGAMAVYVQTNEPVEIIGPSRDPNNRDIFGKVKVRFINSPTGESIDLNLTQLRGPKNIPQEWIPGNSGEIPANSVILKELDRAQQGVDFMNSWYERLGLDIRVPDIDKSKFKFIPENGSLQNQNQGGEIQLVLAWIVGSVPTVTGYSLKGKGFNGYVNHAYMTQFAREKTLRMVGHEWLGHSTHQMFPEHVAAYYTTDKELFEALEHWTEFIAFESAKAYGFYNETTPNWHRDTKWAHRLMEKFNFKGLDGEKIVMDYGSRADMIGLEKLYDQYYGVGEFRTWQKNVFYDKNAEENSDTQKATKEDSFIQHAGNLLGVKSGFA